MATSPQQSLLKMIDKLPETTGKSLDSWLNLIRPRKFAKHGEIMKFLKAEHGLSHGYANLIAQQALGRVIATTSEQGNDLVLAQYAGAKKELKPIYQAILENVEKFGTDVEVAPKKAYVSLRRKKQFAILQPSTATRLDVGINLKGVKPTSRLESSGSFNAMVSHRVRLSSLADVDKQLIAWLRQAYEAS